MEILEQGPAPEPEVWRPVAIRPSYQVSNLGRIRSTKMKRAKRLQLLDGCNMVKLNGGKGEKDLNSRLHRLVAIAFVPNPDNLPNVRPRNGIRTDDRASNLEWVSVAQTMADRVMPPRALPTGVKRNRGKFEARISAGGDRDAPRIHLGTFDTPEEAGAAYHAALERLRGEGTRV